MGVYNLICHKYHAHRCLRRNAYLALTQKLECVQVVNPERCTKGEGCKYFRDNTHVIYARGFLNFQKKMTQEQYQKFLDILQSKFGRNPYFERSNGNTLLTAEDQAVILETLRKVDIKDVHKFDSYIEAAKIVKLHCLMSPHSRSTPVLVVRVLQSS